MKPVSLIAVLLIMSRIRTCLESARFGAIVVKPVVEVERILYIRGPVKYPVWIKLNPPRLWLVRAFKLFFKYFKTDFANKPAFCKLSVASLQDNAAYAYEAPSYRQRGTSITDPILLKGQIFDVTSNFSCVLG